VFFSYGVRRRVAKAFLIQQLTSSTDFGGSSPIRFCDGSEGHARKPYQLSESISVASSASARLSKGYSPLDPDMALRDAVAELDRRIKEIIAEIGRSENQLRDKIEDQDRRHDKLSQALNQYMSEQDENTKRRDRRGIRWLLAGSSGFGPAWRVDGGKIVSLTA